MFIRILMAAYAQCQEWAQHHAEDADKAYLRGDYSEFSHNLHEVKNYHRLMEYISSRYMKYHNPGYMSDTIH